MKNLEKIQAIIKQHHLGNIDSINPAYEFASIGSNGIFHIKTEKGEYSIKFIDNLTKLNQRVDYHNLLCKFLPMPTILSQQENYFILEYLGGECLLKKTIGQNNGYFNLIEASIKTLSTLWERTFGQEIIRNCSELISAGEIIENFLGRNYELPVISNEKSLDYNVKETFSAVLSILRDQPILCLAHGDAHFDNIIVQNDNNLSFIDARPNLNWLDDLAISSWLRSFRFIEFSLPPTIKSNEKKLEINFQIKLSLLEKEVEKISWNIGQDFASKIKCNWPQEFYLTLAACAFCEIAGVINRKKRGVLDRALPENIEYFWIVEAIENYSLAQKNNPRIL